MEFTFEGRRFVQYGIAPVKMASMRASMRKAAKGTQKNPIIKDGKEYVYAPDGRLLRLEHHDRKVVKANTVALDEAQVQEVITKLEAVEDESVGSDDECPELTDEQIAFYLDRVKGEKTAAGEKKEVESIMGGHVLEFPADKYFFAGKAEGNAEGEDKEKVSGIRRAIEKQNMNVYEAMDYMDIPRESREKYLKLMEKDADATGYTAE